MRAALRVGAYQLLHGVAAHAAVGETVAATPQRARGLVNAVLRRVSEAGPPWPEPAGPATRLSYPDWIVDELAGLLEPAEVEAVLGAGNVPAARHAAARTRGRPTADALETELRAPASRSNAAGSSPAH